MSKKNFVLFLALCFLVSRGIRSQELRFHGKFSNTTYSYETDKVHTRLYQTIRFSAEKPNWNKLALIGSFRALTDLNETIDDDLRYKFYQLNLQVQDILGHLDFVAGRFFLHPGTVLGAVDGMQLDVHLTHKIAWKVYGGVESHFNRSIKIYESQDGWVAGSLFEWEKLLSNTFQLLYLQKTDDEETYWQITGLNIVNTQIPHTQLKIQSHYDLKNSRFHKLLFNARYSLGTKLFLAYGYKNQYPQVYSNSFFTIFEIDPYQKHSIDLLYNLTNSIFASGTYQLIQLDDETANQVIISLGNNSGNIGLIYESGYGGDHIGAMVDYAYWVTKNLCASAYVDYSHYRTQEIYEYENQLANALRMSYRFNKRWLIDLEYQWLTNRFQESDSRILNHIHLSW
ncbi:hypothetical protein JXJ21_13600 [candidate division KSB1 bacterium]|nr:hypothetical protein [candidate division KSB1 bacterium]